MKRKLAPALSRICGDDAERPLSILAVGRRTMTSDEYREYLKKTGTAPK
ncbi:MAG: hypothetical protein QG650_1151 [Patescibacteria group bacterium]|nr:hypothetical protein [Patescibacteria group bacterium]